MEPLRSGSIIAGIIALEEKHTRHLTVRYLILKTPNRAGAQLTVLNTNGEVAYVGNAQPNGEEFRFSLRDVGSERLATQIEGTISEDAMNFEVRVWRGTPRPKNRPLAMATTGGKSSECPTCVRRR